ncbi:MAG: hypothetical protein ACFB6R_02220 [Alphaproteobacteria bacterium]
MTVNLVWRRILRPLLAFGLASAAAAFVLLVILGFDFLGGDGLLDLLATWGALSLYVAVFACVPTCAAVWAVRIFRLPRPWSEGVAGFFMGPLIFAVLFMPGRTIVERIEALFMEMTGLIMAVPGIVAAMVYWWVVGRPTRIRPSAP